MFFLPEIAFISVPMCFSRDQRCRAYEFPPPLVCIAYILRGSAQHTAQFAPTYGRYPNLKVVKSFLCVRVLWYDENLPTTITNRCGGSMP